MNLNQISNSLIEAVTEILLEKNLRIVKPNKHFIFQEQNGNTIRYKFYPHGYDFFCEINEAEGVIEWSYDYLGESGKGTFPINDFKAATFKTLVKSENLYSTRFKDATLKEFFRITNNGFKRDKKLFSIRGGSDNDVRKTSQDFDSIEYNGKNGDLTIFAEAFVQNRGIGVALVLVSIEKDTQGRLGYGRPDREYVSRDNLSELEDLFDKVDGIGKYDY